MKMLSLILVLILSICVLGCTYKENQGIVKKLSDSFDNFHGLFNQEKFDRIYSEADVELKNKFTEQQFVSYLEVVKNDVGEINIKPHIWINSDLKDEVKRIFFERTEFSNSQVISTEKSKYTEKFHWIVRDGEAKITSYEVNKLCDNPCTIGISRK